MFRVETRGGASVVWRQSETAADEPTGSYAPRGKWSAGGRGFRSRAYAHVSEGAASGTDSLTATGITTGQPTLGAPTLAQIHSLSATGITTGQPTLGSPALGVGSGAVDLVALGFITGVPLLGSPAMGQIHVLGSTGITTGVPTVGSATNTTESSVLGSRVGTKKSDYPVRRRP
jgi:hypothetical protein